MTDKYIADYCPACGGPTSQQMQDGRPRPVCPACGYIVYFDPKVAVVNFVTDGKRVLLVQRANDPGKGLWAMAGGYVEVDEHPEDAARREMREETGLEIETGRVLDVFWRVKDGGVITIAYEARVTGGTLAAGDDAQTVAWFTRDHLPELVFSSTITLCQRWASDAL